MERLWEGTVERARRLPPERLHESVGGEWSFVIGKQKFEDVEKRFKAMGFDRAFPPGTPPETTIAALREILQVEDEA